MKSSEFSKRVVGISLAGLASLGLTACHGSKSNTQPVPSSPSVSRSGVPCPTTNNELKSLHLIGAAKDGGINAINTGICAELVDPVTGMDAGRGIATDEAFEFLCALPEKEFFQVKTAAGIGDVLLSQELATKMAQSDIGNEALISTCNENPV